MKVTEQAQRAISFGFATIIDQFKLPSAFPSNVLDDANEAIAPKNGSGRPAWCENRRDVTHLPLVTLDPASSTDLDQAFCLDRDGENLVLHYALADVGAFVRIGSAIETEAFERGVTIYGLAEKIPLYPKCISQSAASLLPDGPRPAVLVTVAVSPSGALQLRGVERVVCQSQAKLAYDSVDMSKLPYLEEFARRMWMDEQARGAVRVEFPKQEVIVDETAPGGVRLDLLPRKPSESVNATLSLAANMALGSLMKEAGVGLFRVMDDPEPRAVNALRRAAHALGIGWLESESLRDLQRQMDPSNLTHQRFLLEARRAGGRASYAEFSQKKAPWHSAIAATYGHATAPMRRLADRYVLDLACLLVNSEPVPAWLSERIANLPAVMARCEGKSASVDRAVIDLLEAVSLQHRIGEVLEAEVVDADAGMVQTRDSAIRSRATKLPAVKNGDIVRVRIDVADPLTRRVRLSVA